MKTVFLTGGGGAAIPGLIKSLKGKGYRVLVGDMESLSVGLYLADKAYKLPEGLSSEFLPAVKKICKKENVDAFIPLVDEELVSSLDLEKDKIPVLLPREAFISLCLDKYNLMTNLVKEGITIPKTKLASEGANELKYPIIAKPRVGRGSRGVRILKSKEDLDSYMRDVQDNNSIIMQEYIEGKEFTVSVIVWRDGNVLGVVPKEIIKKEGITKMAVSRRNEKIRNICEKIQRQMEADGPFNVQLKIDSNGDPYVFEINPRFSTSISLTMACGIDELSMLLDQALNGKKKSGPIEWEEGVVLLRQTKDVFIKEDDFYSRLREIESGN